MNILSLSAVATLVALTGCGGSSPTGPDAPTVPDATPDATPDQGAAARDAFRATFEGQHYGDLPDALTRLQAANAAEPSHPDTVLLLGLANLWGVAEAGRDPAAQNLIPARAMAMIQVLTEAKSLRPDDYRINGWLGTSLIGVGQFTGNQAMIDQGTAMLAEGVQRYPEFNLFVDALVNQSHPVGSPELDQAIDDYYVTLDRCFDTTIDRDNPDVSAFLGQQTQTGTKRVCWDNASALHNFEGYFLAMGDALVKAGRVGPARVAYQDAMLVTQSASWPFKQMNADRIAMIDARAALYADADPNNDPPLIGETDHQCASCHAASAD